MRGKLNSGDHKMAQDKQAEIVRWLHSVAAASPVPPEEISDRGLTSSPNHPSSHPLYSQHKHTDKSGATAKPDLSTRCRVLARPRVSSLVNVLPPQRRLQSHRPIPSLRERQKSLSPLPDPTQHSELPLFVLEKDTELTENQRPRPLMSYPTFSGTPSKPKLPLTSTFSLDRRPPISSNLAAHRRTMAQPQQESNDSSEAPRTLVRQKISLSDEHHLATVEASSHDSSSELSTDRGRSRSPVYNVTPGQSEDEGSNPPVTGGVAMRLCHEEAVLQPQMLLLRGRTEELEKETDITSECQPSGRVSPAPVQLHASSARDGLSKQKLQLLQKMQSFTFDDEGEELFTTSQKKRFLSKKWSPHPDLLQPRRRSLSDYSGSSGSSDPRRTPSLVGTRPLSPQFLCPLVEGVTEPSSSQRVDHRSHRVEQDRVRRQDSGIGTVSTNFDVIL